MILTSKISMKTARHLSYAIWEASGGRKRILYTARAHKVSRLHIRYGNIDPVSCSETEFNSLEAINFLRNKLNFSKCLLKNGYVAPEFIQERLPNAEEFPILIRKTLTGFRGQGIIVCKDMEIFQRYWRNYTEYFWCKYLNNSSEFRLHIVKPSTGDPQIIRVMRKVARNQEVENQNIKVRHLNNYYYSRRFEAFSRYPKMLGKAVEVAKLLPGKFFTLDVAWSRDISDVIFFETNTASGLDTKGAAQYAKFFIKEGVI